MSSQNRDNAGEAARNLQMQQAAAAAMLEQQQADRDRMDAQSQSDNMDSVPVSGLERAKGTASSTGRDKPAMAVPYTTSSANPPKPPPKGSKMMPLPASGKSNTGSTGAGPVPVSQSDARKPLPAPPGAPPVSSSSANVMKSASVGGAPNSTVPNSNSIPTTPMNGSKLSLPHDDNATDDSRSEFDGTEDRTQKHGILQKLKACRESGFSCVPKWVGDILFKIIVCLCLLIPAFICLSAPHQSYDLFVSRNGKPVYFAMEAIRFSLYFAGSYAIYSIAIYFVAIVIRIIQLVPRLFCCWSVSHKCASRFDYLNGTKEYIVYILFFLGVLVLTRTIIVDNDIQRYKPPPTATNSSLVMEAVAASVASQPAHLEPSCGSYTFICGGKKKSTESILRSSSQAKMYPEAYPEQEGEYEDGDDGIGSRSSSSPSSQCQMKSSSVPKKNPSSKSSSVVANKAASPSTKSPGLVSDSSSSPGVKSGGTSTARSPASFNQLRGDRITNFNWVFYWTQFILVCFIFSIMLALEKLFVQTVAVSFHEGAFEERVAELNRKFSIFDHLAKIAVHATDKPFSKIGEILKGTLTINEDEEDEEKAIPSLNAMNLTGSRSEIRETFSRKEAKKNTDMLFKYFTTSSGRDYIVADDLRPFYRGDGHEKAIAFFDPEATGQVTKHMMKESICNLFKERRDLHDSLHDHGLIITKFDNLLKGLLFLLCAIIGLSLFNFSVTTYLASMATFALSFTFVFGGFLKNIFEDLLYIFTSHPFDIGDALLLDGDNVTVTKIEILSTTFTRWDGQLIYVPTQNLINKNIYNIRRSGYQSEVFEVQLAVTTSLDKIGNLRKNITEALAAETNDFSGKVTMSGFDVDGDKMKIKFIIEHRGNFQDAEAKAYRHSKIKQTLKEKLEALQITYFGV